jgi:hypothetical protein
MIKMRMSVCINAPAEKVWSVLGDFASVHVWVDAIERSYCPGNARGVGATRVCELKQGTIRERVVEWDEGRSFRYRAENAPLLKSAMNQWSIESLGEQTLVISSSEAELKGGVFGRLIEPILKGFFKRMGAQSMASLKYLIENGHPYKGSSRRLLPIPSAC